MKIGVVEIPEFEVTGVSGSELIVPGLPTDGSIGLAILKPTPGVVEFNGSYARFFVAFTGGGGSASHSIHLPGPPAESKDAYPPSGWAYFV
jgi:hypothetical protein